jgi:hypothetical protein
MHSREDAFPRSLFRASPRVNIYRAINHTGDYVCARTWLARRPHAQIRARGFPGFSPAIAATPLNGLRAWRFDPTARGVAIQSNAIRAIAIAIAAAVPAFAFATLTRPALLLPGCSRR